MVDSHVHLAYWAVGDELAKSGIEVAVDLAAPERTLATPPGPLHVLSSGPMLTHPNGYPLDQWGSDGFGIGCSDEACVTSTVDRLAGEGVKVIKIALDDDGLSPALVPAAVREAHAKGLEVATHALSNDSALLAAQAGVDILAHTPVEPLSDATVMAWSKGTVISTLAAFGGSDSAVENLRKLRAAGTRVLYGTDLGNLRDAGPSDDEISLMKKAGMDDAAIVDAMTTTPLAFWGVDDKDSYLVLAKDPRQDVNALVHPREVYLRGRRLR
jgi:imidazolonepropionase-like amidohydrolase